MGPKEQGLIRHSARRTRIRPWQATLLCPLPACDGSEVGEVSPRWASGLINRERCVSTVGSNPCLSVSLVYYDPEQFRSRKFKAVAMAKAMGLSSAFSLTSTGVAENVTRRSPGAYVLGKLGADGVFYIDYAGRSDDDVAGRLMEHVSEAPPQFCFAYYSSAEAAYLKECQLYHDFNPPKNKVHPAKPRGSNRSCPVCWT